jgi:hypothetical protein
LYNLVWVSLRFSQTASDFFFRINLKKDIHKGTYSPVRFVVLDKDGQPLEKPLFVGDIFKLLFFLADTNGKFKLDAQYEEKNGIDHLHISVFDSQIIRFT